MMVDRRLDQGQRMVGPLRADGQERPPPPQQPLNCPRCDSLNTKFCYYNNYSLSQPRHFCKACRRYWTQGGTLRNVPVGGGCRKKSRSKSTSTAAASSSSASSAETSHFSQHHPVQASGSKSSAVPPPPAVGGMLPIHYHGSVGLLSSLAAIQPSLNYQQDPLGGPSLLNRRGVGAGNPSGTNLGFLPGFGMVNPMVSSLNNHSQQHQHTQAFLRDVYPSSGANTSNAADWSIDGTGSSSGVGGPTVNLNGLPYSNLPGYGHPPRNF